MHKVVDEVVVVAYGVRKKGTVTGSVSTVKSEKLESVPAAGFDQALQGQTPGLMVMSNSGEPSKAAGFPDSWYQLYQLRYFSVVYSRRCAHLEQRFQHH